MPTILYFQIYKKASPLVPSAYLFSLHKLPKHSAIVSISAGVANLFPDPSNLYTIANIWVLQIVPVFPFSLSDRTGVAEDDVQHWVAVLLAVYGAGLLGGSRKCLPTAFPFSILVTERALLIISLCFM